MRRAITSVRLEPEVDKLIEQLSTISKSAYGFPLTRTDIIRQALALGLPELQKKMIRVRDAQKKEAI